MDYEKLYKEALGRANAAHKDEDRHLKATLERIFPELKESEDERIRKNIKIALMSVEEELADFYSTHHTSQEEFLTWLEKQGTSYTKKDVDDAYVEGMAFAKNELEKQYEATYQIRKDIATFIFNHRGDIKDRAKWMNYLGIKVSFVEGQGGQKPTDKVEPKFHEGDWIVFNGLTLYIKEVVNGYYRTISFDGINNSYDWDIDNIARLWTIQDARDGDVLATWAGAFIYNNNNGGGSCPGCYCGINTLGKFQTGVEHHWTGKKVYPATKEQRDLLFQKVKEAGYEWDAEKNKLRKISQRIISAEAKEALYDNAEDFEEELTNIVFTNTATSELPVKRLMELCHIIYKDVLEAARKEIEKNPSNSGKPAWSEEDEKMFNSALWHIKNSCGNGGKTNGEYEVYTWLKSLKKRIR